MGMIFGKIDVAQPDFAVVKRHAAYEIRRYVPYAVAEVSGQASSQREFGNMHFRTLAQYIGVFGTPNNTRKEGMAMTAPVISSMSGKGQPERMDMTAPVLSTMGSASGVYSMGFVLPAKYSAANAPTPNDPRVSIRQVPARWVAVHTFSGEVGDHSVQEKSEWLIGQVRQDGYAIHPAPHGQAWELARYNPPFTIPMLKTNEIQIHLQDLSGEA